MAHQPMYIPDPNGDSRPEDDSVPAQKTEPEWTEDDRGGYLAELAATLASHGGGDASADLALDLLLNDIVEQARLATLSTGAAVALLRGDEMICRATVGNNAPDLGVRLNTRSGLCGACVQSKQVQRCDDTETDSRVDAASCGLLDIRSMLVLPILDGTELLGVFEVFSPRPHAFGDMEVQTVQALCRKIVQNIHQASEASEFPIDSDADSSPVLHFVNDVKHDSGPELRISLDPEPTKPKKAHAGRRDHWTALLTVVVIGLALLLGWMVGRAGWEMALSTAKTKAEPAPGQETASQEIPNETAAAPAAKPEKKEVSSSQPKGAKPTGSKSSDAASKKANDTGVVPPGGLVVSQNGKVIFQMLPGKSKGTKTESAYATAPATGADGSEGNPKPVSLSPDTANTYLLQRVEPQYPDEAKQQGIQGSVVLDAVIGADGTVRGLNPISGNPRLRSAAIEAVQQWHYKPYVVNGTPVDFETTVTINFTLPSNN
jgi:TonB family protein